MFENLLGQKLTISEDTLKQPELSNKEKGRRRMERLKEIDASGDIEKCKDRVELAKACGYTNEKAGGVWAGRMIRQGYVKEYHAYDPNNPFAKRYKVTPKIAKYNKKNRGSRRASVPSGVVSTQTQTTAPKPVEKQEGKVAVEYGGTRITFENVSPEYISKVLKGLK